MLPSKTYKAVLARLEKAWGDAEAEKMMRDDLRFVSKFARMMLFIQKRITEAKRLEAQGPNNATHKNIQPRTGRSG